MADAFKSDYFNMPVHVSTKLFRINLSVSLSVSLMLLFVFFHVFVTDGTHRAGGERVLAFGGSH